MDVAVERKEAHYLRCGLDVSERGSFTFIFWCLS